MDGRRGAESVAMQLFRIGRLEDVAEEEGEEMKDPLVVQVCWVIYVAIII